MIFKSLRGVFAAASVAAAALAASMAQDDGVDRTIDRRSRSALAAASEAIPSGDRKAQERAYGKVERMLDRDDLTPYENALALDMRARLRLLLAPSDLDAAFADFDAALSFDALWPGSAASTCELVVRLFAENERFDPIATFFEAHGDHCGDMVALGPIIAEAYARLERPDEALAVLTDAIDAAETGASPLEASRYIILFQMRRAEEAEAALNAYAASRFGPKAVVALGREHLAQMRRGDMDNEALRAATTAFLQADSAWRSVNFDAEPLERAHPRSFERCLNTIGGARVGRERKQEATVVIDFDVEPDGTTSNVRIVESDDPCFDRYASDAVERWTYKPAHRDGRPALRQGVRTKISFVMSRS